LSRVAAMAAMDTAALQKGVVSEDAAEHNLIWSPGILDVPRSILKPRSVKPIKQMPLHSFPFCCHRRPRVAHFVRRKGKHITFQNSIEVVKFSRAIGRDAVPGDNTDLAVGLGRPIWKGSLPIAGKRKRGWQLEEHCYLQLESRSKMLMEAMGQRRSLEVMAWHRKKTRQVIRWRAEAMNDSKSPPEMMPRSYREAKERALKVAAEVRARRPAMPKMRALDSKVSKLPKACTERLSNHPRSKENRIPRFMRRPQSFLRNRVKQRSGLMDVKDREANRLKELSSPQKSHQRSVLVSVIRN